MTQPSLHNLSDPQEALRYLIATRDYIAEQLPPSNYRQHPHSGDPVPVGGDIKRPAMLDASYGHFERNLLSISMPGFMKIESPPMLNAAGEIVIHDGLTMLNIGSSLQTVLKTVGVCTDDMKIGFSHLDKTAYIELDALSPKDYAIGHNIIQALVHGNAATDEQLISRMAAASAAREKPDPVPAPEDTRTNWKARLAKLPFINRR